MSSSPTESVHSHSQPSSEKGKQREESITPISPTSYECVAAVQSLSTNGEQVHTATPVSGTTATNGEQVGTTLADWVNTASPTSKESTPTNTVNTANGNSTPSSNDANSAVGNASHPTNNNPHGTPNATINPLEAAVSPVAASQPELPGGHTTSAHQRPLVITHVNPQGAGMAHVSPQGVAMGRTTVVSPTTPNFAQPPPTLYAMHAGGPAHVAVGGQYHRHPHSASALTSRPQAYVHPGVQARAQAQAQVQAQAQAQAATHQAVPSNAHHAVRRQAPSAPHVQTSRLTGEQNVERMAVTSGMHDVLDVKLRTNSEHLGSLFQRANTLKSHVDSLNEKLRQATIYKDQLGPSDEVATKLKNITDKLEGLTRQCEHQGAIIGFHANAAAAQTKQSSGLQGLVSSLETDVSLLRQDLGRLHGGCREQFQVLSGLTPSFHKLDQRVNDVDQRLNDADKRVNDIEFSTQCNEKSLADAHREFSDLQTSFATVQSETAKVQKNLSDLADRFESLKTDVNTTELNSDDAASDARKAKEAIEPLRADIVTVQEELKRAHDNFVQLHTTVTHLQGEVGQAKTQVTHVQEHLVQVQKDNSQTRQDLEKVRARVNNFNDEQDKIRKLIAGVETQVNKRVTAIDRQMVDYEISQRKDLDALAAQQRKAFGAFTAQKRREFDAFVMDQRKAMRRLEDKLYAQKANGAYSHNHNDRVALGDKRQRDGG